MAHHPRLSRNDRGDGSALGEKLEGAWGGGRRREERVYGLQGEDPLSAARAMDLAGTGAASWPSMNIELVPEGQPVPWRLMLPEWAATPYALPWPP
ncbi:unnamed protein product [Arctogadus glacialis]